MGSILWFWQRRRCVDPAWTSHRGGDQEDAASCIWYGHLLLALAQHISHCAQQSLRVLCWATTLTCGSSILRDGTPRGGPYGLLLLTQAIGLSHFRCAFRGVSCLRAQRFAYQCFVEQRFHPNQIPYTYLWSIFDNRGLDIAALFPSLDRTAIVQHLLTNGIPADART